jgi:hypothetical protein
MGRAALSRLNSDPATTAVEMRMVMPEEMKGVRAPLKISAAKLTLEISVTMPAMMPDSRMDMT